MKVFSTLLVSAVLLSWAALASGQSFRCNRSSRNPTCVAARRTRRRLRAVLGSATDSFPYTLSENPADDTVVCSPEYRTLDGSCTTLTDPLFGASGTTQFTYVASFSSAVPNGDSRPSARMVSNVVSSQPNADMPNRRGIILFFVFFGQLLDHDLALTPSKTEEPFNIPVHRNDRLFANLTSCTGRDCRVVTAELPFSQSVRIKSTTEPNLERPVNVLSSPIDLSNVYGTDQERFELLHTSGSCKMQMLDDKYLPKNTAGMENEPSADSKFFAGGDVRANENPTLTSLHIIWLREHNKLCDDLAQDFPKLSQEKLFQLARKVNIYQMQKIVYEKFLPAIMGRQLSIGPFNPSVNPSVSDIFSTAAFRLGHTMVGDTLPTGKASNPELTAVDMLFQDSDYYMSISTPEEYLLGSTKTVAQEIDVLVVDALRNFLFANVAELSMGLDLIALNLQRGRDHALPSYNTVRAIFGLPRLTNFDQVTSDVNLRACLRRVYNNVDDMDLWVALLAEDHVAGASMGITMFRICRAEFKRLAEGDRFFYPRSDLFEDSFKKKFTRFNAISSSTTLMHDILVRNSEGTFNYPKSVFRPM